MEKEEYLSKLHKEILIIMDEIDRVCKENNLTYYLVGGSLLGAVRHKGFIPWDDDFDIAMPREDFEKFTNVYYKDLRYPFTLKWDTTEENHNLPFAKVENKETIFGEEHYIKNDCPFGIFVDIFPLDTSSGYNRFTICKKKIIEKLRVYRNVKKFHVKLPYYKRFFLICISSKMLSYLLKRISTLNKNNGVYFSNYGSQYNIKKQTILKEYYGIAKKMQFEDRLYCVPSNEMAILTSIYGPDYMKLPPLDRRRIHYPLIVKFSNQEIIEFELCKNKVAIE